MNYKKFIEDRQNKTTYLGGGKITPLIITRTSKIILEKRYLGNHTEITRMCRKEIQPEWI